MRGDNELSLVLGVNGQNGSYLAEALLAKGKTVVGVGCQKNSRYVKNSKGFSYRQLDITNIKDLELLLND